jgi:ataxin-10
VYNQRTAIPLPCRHQHTTQAKRLILMPSRRDAEPAGGSRYITDSAAAREMGMHVDELVLLAQTDAEMRMACVKFQMEHAAAKAAYCEDEEEDELEHLDATLKRMLDLAVYIGTTVLRRAVENTPRNISPVSPLSDTALPASPTSASSAPGIFNARNSSVEDLSHAGSDLSWERNAAAMQHSCRIAALAFIVSEKLRPRLQHHALQGGLLPLCRGGLCIARAVELRCFAEGFKTEHMNAVSNFTYGNRDVCEAVAADEQFLLSILTATRIDEENPGLVEWAEFTIRNICGMSTTACDVIKAQRPLSKPAMM